MAAMGGICRHFLDESILVDVTLTYVNTQSRVPLLPTMVRQLVRPGPRMTSLSAINPQEAEA